MKKYLLLLLTFSSLTLNAQLQSTPEATWANGKNAIKVDGDLSRSINQKDWQKVQLGTSREQDVYMIEVNKATKGKYNYSFMPRGGLQLDENTLFLVGMYGTYDYQGMILKSRDFGKTWKYFIHPTRNTYTDAYNLFFINDAIGIVIFERDEQRNVQYAITYDQGETWETGVGTSNKLSIKSKKFRLEAEVELDEFITTLSGQYSEDRGKTWQPTNFERLDKE